MNDMTALEDEAELPLADPRLPYSPPVLTYLPMNLGTGFNLGTGGDAGTSPGFSLS